MTPLYRFLRGMFKVIFFGLFRLRTSGRDHEPASGGAIVCANHFVWWDSPLVATLFRRHIRFMARHEWFEHWFLGPIMRRVKAFPVRRHTADRSSLRQALEVLEGGELLGIFPEGTRSRTGELKRGEPGVGYLALKSRAPVIPVGLSYRDGKLRAKVGAPMTFPDLYAGRTDSDASQAVTDAIMDRIATLKAEAAALD